MAKVPTFYPCCLEPTDGLHAENCAATAVLRERLAAAERELTALRHHAALCETCGGRGVTTFQRRVTTGRMVEIERGEIPCTNPHCIGGAVPKERR